MFPMTQIAQLSCKVVLEWLSAHRRRRSTMASRLALQLIAVRVALIVFFCYFYTAVTFNPVRTSADNLKKYGGFIPGIRPGKKTAEYIDYVLTRITVVGAAYLAVICIIPEILIKEYSVPFYLGGTSLLIVVSVTMDTVTQIHGHLLAHQYEGLIKKSRLRGRKG